MLGWTAAAAALVTAGTLMALHPGWVIAAVIAGTIAWIIAAGLIDILTDPTDPPTLTDECDRVTRTYSPLREESTLARPKRR